MLRVIMWTTLFILLALFFTNCARVDGHDGSLQDNGEVTFSDGFGPCYEGVACTVPPQIDVCYDLRLYYELTSGVFCKRQPATTTTTTGRL